MTRDIEAPLALKLPSNQLPDRFYRGGDKIARLRRVAGAGDRAPEDWVASVTTLAGEESDGLTLLPDGSTLRERIAADPLGWLGPEHLAAFGPDPMLLVKLLNPEQRLPVHVHPDVAFAHGNLGRPHGKAEAWSMIEGGEVYLGLKRDISRAALLDLVNRQDTAGLLGLLHRRVVERGDIVFVPPGTLHAIGAQTLLVEAQEPEDLSILLEWSGFELDGLRDGHLGVGFDRAVSAITTTAIDDAALDELIAHPVDGVTALAPSGTGYFRMERITVEHSVTLDPGYAVSVAEEGQFVVSGTGSIELERGDVLLTPHAAGAIRLEGTGTIVVSRPPAPASRRGETA